jgi:hypothetical protein
MKGKIGQWEHGGRILHLLTTPHWNYDVFYDITPGKI